MKCLFFLILLISIIANATTSPTNLALTKTAQNTPCRFTCDNADYVRPGSQLIINRELHTINEKIGKQIKKAYDLIQASNPNIAPNPKKALSILKKMDLQELNSQEKFFVHKLQGFSYISLNDNTAAIESYTKILEFSSEIDAKDELQTLHMLAMLHSMNKNHSSSLKYQLQWANMSNQIESKDYRNFSATYEALDDLPHAIANQARALELADSHENPPLADYIQLKKLYQLNNQVAESDKIQSILDSIPGAKKLNNNEPVPIVKVAFEYPPNAIARGIEGDCIVTFDVTPTGSTENLQVKNGDCTSIDGKPTDIFSHSSIKAAKRFKYVPTIENGKPVYVRNVTNKFSYRISQ